MDWDLFNRVPPIRRWAEPVLSNPTPGHDLRRRAAEALGWSHSDVRSVSMASLRDLVRPVDPQLAREMSYHIQSDRAVQGRRR